MRFPCVKDVFAFQANDRVIQIKNNCDKEVFNGDIRVIESINAEKRTLEANFDDRIIECDVMELDEKGTGLRGSECDGYKEE